MKGARGAITMYYSHHHTSLIMIVLTISNLPRDLFATTIITNANNFAGPFYRSLYLIN